MTTAAPSVAAPVFPAIAEHERRQREAVAALKRLTYERCPACRGFNLERRWCDHCGGSGFRPGND